MMKENMLIFNMYLFFILSGITKTIIGPVLPSMIENYGVTLTVAGLILSVLSFGRLISVITATFLLDNVGYKPILTTGAALMSIGLIGFTMSIWWWGHVLFILFVGLGIGLIGSSSNALIAEVNTDNKGKALNHLHMFFGVGSLIGPLIAGFLLSYNLNWRVVFWPAVIFSLMLLILIVTREFPEKVVTKDKRENSLVRLGKLIHSPIFYFLAIVMFVYVGVGNGIMGWMNKYLGDVMSFSGMAASGVLALYTLGITVGRLTCGLFVDSLGYKKTILLCSIGSLLSITLAVMSNMIVFILIGFALTGFFMAGLFPTAIAYGTSLFPEMLGTISSALITTAVIGGTTIPWVMGAISDNYGLKGGMMITIVLAIILSISSILLFFTEDRKKESLDI